MNPVPKGPYFSVKAGLSYLTFGELLHYTRELGPGRYPIEAAECAVFHLVLYEDKSWRVSTPQLDLFEPHTLT